MALFSSQPLKVHPPSGGSQRGPPGARRTGESRGRHTQKNRPNPDLSATGSPPLPYLSARPPAWVSPPRFKLSDDPFKLTAGVKLPRRALYLPRRRWFASRWCFPHPTTFHLRESAPVILNCSRSSSQLPRLKAAASRHVTLCY